MNSKVIKNQKKKKKKKKKGEDEPLDNLTNNYKQQQNKLDRTNQQWETVKYKL